VNNREEAHNQVLGPFTTAMKNTTLLPASFALTGAGMLLLIGTGAEAFSIAGGPLPLNQRHFRIYNNFGDPGANDNQVANPNLPGYTGATLAIWKGVAEWGSSLHGVGDGDPHQPGDLGSGGANFDSSFQGEAPGVGSTNDNIFSEISGSSGGVLAFIELPATDGWRARFYGGWTWSDGPGAPAASEFDLQAITCRLYGFALGLGTSAVAGATMASTITTPLLELRSIEEDDQAGVQAIYGVASTNKPIINGYVIGAGQIEVHGLNFDATGNQVWFTPAGLSGQGVPIKLTGLASSGTSLIGPLPAGAGSGDILIQTSGTGHADLSNAWPVNLAFGTPCPPPQVYCASLANSTGMPATLTPTGNASLLGSNDLQLIASGAPANSSALFFFGPNQIARPFGNGIRCVGGSLSRMPVLVTSPTGTANQPIDLHGPPFTGNGAAGVSIGDKLNFQFWFRDPAAGGANFNTSDGIAVEVCP
jgi:hypothetical protein